ncbi:hypothetical protein I551_5244 [Mycobacterium ulcerans str. Harvey]|uniref:Uncharacterized protein n=1 Tax=Mycobacterium ulcerans str. Harvey TaxID=1299332 RepID=A0ABP3AAD9_MYCUL|nr:hypothetical protein I551_5244 [Mycobacterium ulcerans str. Harvey]
MNRAAISTAELASSGSRSSGAVTQHGASISTRFDMHRY